MWRIIAPLECTNLVENPSLELAATGYNVMAGAGARVATVPRRGLFSYECTPAAAAYDGMYYATVDNGTSTYTFSCDFKGAAGVEYRLYFATIAAAVLGTPNVFTATGAWQRMAVTYTSAAVAARRLYVTKGNNASVAPFYVDGLQCVEYAEDTTYLDGDQLDCRWLGLKHSSTSYRPATTRAGGRFVALDTANVLVHKVHGIGMPPNKHIAETVATQPGAMFRGRRTLPRAIQIELGLANASDRTGLHALRAALVDLLKPDLTPVDEPIILEYRSDATSPPLRIECVYDSGLEFNNPDHTYERLALRLICYAPLWFEDGNDAAVLDSYDSVANCDYTCARVAGNWQPLNVGVSATVQEIANATAEVGVYLAGNFVNAGGIAGADYIARWDGATWYELAGGTNAAVFALCTRPDGQLFVGGSFTLAGGVANTVRIARWDGAAWNALGVGAANNNVYALCLDQTGNLYAGGNFTGMGGVASTERIAKWNGAAWSSVGTFNGTVRALCLGADGYIYAAGDFTTCGGVACNRIAKWNGTAWAPLSSGLNAEALALIKDVDGGIIVAGTFTTAGGVACNRIAKWNGANFVPFGAGLNDSAEALALDPEGNIFVGGTFTTAGGRAIADRIAIWNGATWAHTDINLPGAPICAGICFTPAGDLYVGYTANGSAGTSGLTTVVNAGSSTTWPELVIVRGGATNARACWLRNETTGKTIWLDYDMQPGETLTIDFNPLERRIVSSYYGDVLRGMLRNSNWTKFNLVPGENVITLFVDAAASVSAWMTWTIVYWSADR